MKHSLAKITSKGHVGIDPKSILWIWKKEIIEDPKHCFYVKISKTKEENIHYILCTIHNAWNGLKILPRVESSIISKPNLSPPSLPHLPNLLNLPNLLYLLTQNTTTAPSSDLWSV